MTTAWLKALERSLGGRIIRRGDPDMVLSHKQHAARLPFVEPEMLIRCRSAEDVAVSVSALRREGVRFALRSGGHCFADRSTDAAVVVDCAELNEMVIGDGVATFGAGVTAGAAVAMLAPHGRVIPTGGCIGVAVTGLMVAGGFGYSGRRLGFVADRVQAIEVVLADGEIRRIDAASEPELFWACRGGGGAGLAAITAVTIRTATALPGTALYGEWPIERAAELIERWLRFAPEADEAIDIELSLWCSDALDDPCTVRLHGGAVNTTDWTADLAAALGPFGDDLVGTVMAPDVFAEHLVGRRDFRGDVAWQPSFPFRDVGYQATRSQFLSARPAPSALQAVVEQFVDRRRDNQSREVEFIPWRGAYARPDAAACIAHRDAIALVRHTALAGSRSTPGDRSAARSWANASHSVLAAAGASGAYPGYGEIDRPGWAEAAYGAHLPRLESAKARYDPDRIFPGLPPADRHEAPDRCFYLPGGVAPRGSCV